MSRNKALIRTVQKKIRKTTYKGPMNNAIKYFTNREKEKNRKKEV